MTPQAQQLVEQALTLPPEERREIAGALLESMSVDETFQLSAEMMAKVGEIRRRYHAGEEPWISGEEFKAHLKQRLEELRAQNQSTHVV